MQSETTKTPRRRVLLTIAVVGGALLFCLAAAVVVGVAVFAPIRHEVTRVPGADLPIEPSAEESAGAQPETIQDEAVAVAGLVLTSSTGWASHITGVETATVLRRPVIVVSTDIGPEQADLADEVASGLGSFAATLASPGGSPYTYHFRILSSDGELIGTVSSVDDRWRLDVPAAPADPGALRAWLDEVYGSGSPAPEAWVHRMSSVQAGADGSVVVRTDLDPTNPSDLRVAQTLIDAVNSSGAAFASSIRVVFADGVFEWSSILDGTDPYGP